MNVEPVHIWEGSERNLLSYYYATKLTIKKLTGKSAEGEICVKDYIECGIEFSNPWEAVLENGNWIVSRKKDDSCFWMNKKTGEVFFTANCGVNDAIKVFISERIKDFISTGIAKISLAKYDGPIVRYVGSCACDRLELSCKQNPFSWLAFTAGKFPGRCFLCSCGMQWWCSDPNDHLWEKVFDEKAWEMLLTYNGIDVKPIVFFEGAEIKGVKLLQTLVDNGLIVFSNK